MLRIDPSRLTPEMQRLKSIVLELWFGAHPYQKLHLLELLMSKTFFGCLFQKKAKNILRPFVLPKHSRVLMLYVIHNSGIAAPFSPPPFFFPPVSILERPGTENLVLITGAKCPRGTSFLQDGPYSPSTARRCSQTLGALLFSLSLSPTCALALAVSCSCQGDSTDLVTDCAPGKGTKRKHVMGSSL